MKCSVLCSCGVFLRGEKGAILIDAPNEQYAPYEGLSDEELEKILYSQYPYNVPLCIAFTHLHPDHYSEEKLHRILDARPNTEVILPSDTPQKVSLFGGAFTFESYPVKHTKAPGFDEILHNVFFISGEISAYVGADAHFEPSLHDAFLQGRQAEFCFFNAQFLSYPQTRKLILGSGRRRFIYHIPLDDADVSGIRRKALHNMQRVGAEMPDTTLILSYPYEIV